MIGSLRSTPRISASTTTRCRVILSDLVEGKVYTTKAAEGNSSFMRNEWYL